jgi:hypothetical protein
MSTLPSRRIFVASGATTNFLGKGNPNFIWKKHPDFGKKDNPNLKDMLASTIKDCLRAAGVSGALVDKIYVGNFAGELFNQQGHLGSAIAQADDGLLYKPSKRLLGA